MRGWLVSGRTRRLALLGGAGAVMLLAAPALAADPASTTAVGPPTPLFSPSPQAAPPAPQSMRSAAAASPGKHPAPPVQRIPLDTKALIPPAAPPAKLGPPPLDPHPALSLETGLEPFTPAPPTPSQSGTTDATAPPAVKPPSS